MGHVPYYRSPPVVQPFDLTTKLTSAHEIQVVDQLDGLRALRSEWQAMAPDKDVAPWQSYSWMEAAATAFGNNQALHILVLRHQGKMMAIAPLVLKRTRQPLGSLKMHFLGGEELREPNGLIARDRYSMEILFETLATEPVYPIRISRIPKHNGVLPMLHKKFRRQGWITTHMSMPYPYIDLTTYQTKKSLTKDLRRAQKKSSCYGKCCLIQIDENKPEHLQEHLQTAFKIEASGWKGMNRTAILFDPERARFFEYYARALSQEGILRLSFLTMGDRPVAHHFAVESMNNYWLLNIGYDERVKACSPGNQILEASVMAAKQRGLTRYHLLGKVEPWTRRWTKQAQDCVVFAAYRPNLCGVQAMLSDALFMMLRRWQARRVEIVKRRSSISRASPV